MELISGVPAHRGREYETIFVVRPDAGEEAAQKVAGRIVETIDRLQGKLAEVQVWGRRRMAYKVRGHSKGVFIYIRYLGYPGLVEEIERNFRMLDAVLKYQTVKVQHEVDPSTVTVDPEQVKFAGMDFSEEPEEDVGEGGAPTEHGGRSGDYLDYEPEPDAPGDEERAEAAPAEEKAEAAPAEEKAEAAPAEEKAEAAPAEEKAEAAPAEEKAEAAPAEEKAEAAPAEEKAEAAPAEDEAAEEESSDEPEGKEG